MSVGQIVSEDEFNPAVHAESEVLPEAHLRRDAVGSIERERQFFAAERIGIRFHPFDAAEAKHTVNLQRFIRRDVKPGQVDHQLPYPDLLEIRRLERKRFFLGNAFDRRQTQRIVLQNIEGLNAEAIRDFFSERRADTFDPAAGKVAEYGGRRRRRTALNRRDLKLFAEGRVDIERAEQPDLLPAVDIEHGAHGRKKFFSGVQFNHREPVDSIVEGDSIHRSSQFGHLAHAFVLPTIF